ncbi:hypothetical protein DFH28DRAFT_1166770 [Melampsora americana]|nr:hypothetical protein DFH28DRAFT_1166770 [Melampsora americana]
MVSKSIDKHRKNANHLKNAKLWLLEQQNRRTSPAMAPVEDHLLDRLSETPCENDPLQAFSEEYDSADESRKKVLVDMWTRNYSAIFQSPVLSINSSEDNEIRPPRSVANSCDEYSVGSGDSHERVVTHNTDHSWSPFSSLEQLVGLLILGSTRTTMSQLQYERVRSFVALLKVKLPGYKSLGNARRRLKKEYDMGLSETVSPLSKPCFGLQIKEILRQELGNPYSKKWREELAPDLRVQMVDCSKGHFYLFEPTQLQSKTIVIPMFFYKAGADVLAKCVYARVTRNTASREITSALRIEFPSVCNFNSEQLTTINVKTFWKVIDQIELHPNVLLKDSCGGIMYERSDNGLAEMAIHNPWRAKACGRIIRHVPLVLYCDDLSGNVSKRWNKHIAFYFTLAGLPPKFSNQEYNCHFLTTSNRAGALELADPVVDSLNHLETNGLVAFDHNINSEVLVMPVILCHLGDSPMHAEVTNTMNPTSSLTPCRICKLRAASMAKKKSKKYICDFLGIDEVGNPSSLEKRRWQDTIQGTKDLWSLAQQPGNIGVFDTESAAAGLRDSLNMEFVKLVQNLHRDSAIKQSDIDRMCHDLNKEFGERLFNPFLRLKGFDGHKDTPVEILHVVLLGVGKYLLRHQMKNCSSGEKDKIHGRWRSFNTSGLNIPPIQPKTMIQHFQSLNGKEFRTVLQAAPFIFFECDLTPEERETWQALSNLSPYIFQTEIVDMELYLKDLGKMIQQFLKSIVKMSAQWCNKPKFHMLTHLCDAIERYGPAMLFGTENFECYNGNTRQSSIKSNHLSPSRDIGNSFNNHRLIRTITAGTKHYHSQLQTYIQSSLNVRNIFQNNVLFQRALGYNSSWTQEKKIEIGKPKKRQPGNAGNSVPKDIFDSFAAKDWKIISDIRLKNGQSVTTGVFVSVKACAATGRTIGRVKTIWGVGGCDAKQTKVQMNKCRKGAISEFYGMREVEQREKIVWINPQDIDGVLNVQHDCHQSECTVEKTHQIMIERQVSQAKDFEVIHVESSNFVLNSASFYSSALHRDWACLPCHDVTPEEWMEAIEKGIEEWSDTIKERDENREKKRHRERAKLLAGTSTGTSGQPATNKRKMRKTHLNNVTTPSQTPIPSQFGSSPNVNSPVAGPSKRRKTRRLYSSDTD